MRRRTWRRRPSLSCTRAGPRWAPTRCPRLGSDASLATPPSDLREIDLLDHSVFSLRGRDVILAPGDAPGRVVLRSEIDGDRMAFRMLGDSTPPTRSVPDDVWMGLFLVSSPFTWSGAATTGV
jgi:hypothetical protein